MYVERFKLKNRPFVSGADTETFLSDDVIANSIARVRHVMLAGNGAALISGGPGVGKSTIVHQAMHDIGDRAVLVEVDLRQIDSSLLYQMVLLSLGEEISDGSMAQSLHHLREVLHGNTKDGRTVTIAIDINGFTVERANHILRLSHLANEVGCGLNIILMGPHSLHRLLDTPGLIYIRQRIGFRCRLRPFTVAETSEYIRQQISVAKGKPEKLLEDEVGSTVYQYVGGVPRLINTLMDAALSQACANELDRLDVETVHEVAKGLGWRPLSRGEPAKPAAAKASQPAKPAADAKAQQEAAPTRRKNDPARPKADKDGKGKAKEESQVETVTEDEIFEQPLEILADDAEQAVHEGADVISVAASAALGQGQGDSNGPGELTQRLMLAAESLEDDLEKDTEKEPEKKPELAVKAPVQEAAPRAEAPAGVPEMNAEDTSATGMLRLEDLDAHFAETVFGNDTGMFKAIEEMEKMKAAGQDKDS